MENILYIDCSNGLRIGLISDKYNKEFSDTSATKHSSSLMIKIDELLKNANLTIKDVGVIAVCVGPGSFTGIRVAIATAKGLCKGANAKVVTFDSFDCVSVTDRNYGVIVDGFGDNYYYYFKKFGKAFKGCDKASKLKVFAEGINVYTTSDKDLSNLPFSVKKTNYDPKPVITSKCNNNLFIQTNQIAPLYLRASQAEIERQKHGN